MRQEDKKTETEMDITIDPEDIVLDDDSDMPEPETKTYEKQIKLTDRFMTLFENVVGILPYASILRNAKGDQIKLNTYSSKEIDALLEEEKDVLNTEEDA